MSTCTIAAPHEIDKTSAKYAEIVAKMRHRGSPALRVVDMGDSYQAIEGSHRLAAAAELALPVRLIIVNGKRVSHDFEDLPARCKAEVIVDYVTRDLDRPSYFLEVLD